MSNNKPKPEPGYIISQQTYNIISSQFENIREMLLLGANHRLIEEEFETLVNTFRHIKNAQRVK